MPKLSQQTSLTQESTEVLIKTFTNLISPKLGEIGLVWFGSVKLA
jgi:hypothetical protein